MVMDMSHVLTVNRPNKHLTAEFIYAVEEMNAIAQDRDDEVAEAEELFAQNLEKNKGRLEASMKRVMSKDVDNVVQFPFMKNKPEDDDIIH